MWSYPYGQGWLCLDEPKTDGKNYNVRFYSLDMILAIGFRGRSKRGTQFRIWANQHLKQFLVKGFDIDDERLKNPDGRPDYFDELRKQDIYIAKNYLTHDVAEPFDGAVPGFCGIARERTSGLDTGFLAQ